MYISRNLKWGGVDKCLGGENMREAQIYTKKTFKNRKWNTESGEGEVASQLGGGVTISLPQCNLIDIFW